MSDEPTESEDGQGGNVCAVCDVCFNGGACELSVEKRSEVEAMLTLSREAKVRGR